MLEPIEPFLRVEEALHARSNIVVRGWPLTVPGILRNADDARARFSYEHAELVAVSAEATVGDRTLDDLLAGPRLRTRRRYAAVVAERLLEAGFGLLPSFAAPHYSIVLPAYATKHAERLLGLFGEAHLNPYYAGGAR
ncbi:MAG: hypothetical protein ACT4QG_08545 [Sporichthyaceae bacterium]